MAGFRCLADSVPQAVQILSRVRVQSREELLQLQGEAFRHIRQPETQSREEHIRAKHSGGVAAAGPIRTKDVGDRNWETMEAQQVQPGRNIQGLRFLPGGGHIGADHASRRRCGHLRYGRAHSSTGLAVHASDREEDNRLAAGLGTDPSEEHSHCQSTVRVQHGVRVVQADLEGETEAQGESRHSFLSNVAANRIII